VRALLPLRAVLPMILAVVVAAEGDDARPQQFAATQAADVRVQAAMHAARGTEQATINDQVRLCEVPAPPFGERARAAVVLDMLKASGLKNVRFDRAGNVVGERIGRHARPHVVLTAHLDTVFPTGTKVKVRREGTMLRGPGISDNCRGLAVLIAIARAMTAGDVQTEGSITLAATVGEEGLGDLRGVRTLLGETLKGRVDGFVAIDGTGESITNVAVGSRRYRVTFRGSGGHSYNNFGRANPAHALGRAVARISDLPVPSRPKTTFSVGRIGGGTSVNAIPVESWMEIDLRSSDEAALEALDRSVQSIITNAVTLENARWKQNGALTVTSERVGGRPTGKTDPRSRIVQAAVTISSMLGMAARPGEASTEANVAMQMNIPAIAIGGGGIGRGTHTRDETFDSTGSSRGTERALRLAIELASR
jgi:tripeptide aminopeptidase